MPSSEETIACGLSIRPQERLVLVDGNEVPVTPREFQIVSRLSAHPGWVLSAGQLAEDPEDGGYSPESVSVHVSRLRTKLARAGAPNAVETVRGFGYRLRTVPAPVDDTPSASAASCRSLRDASWQLSEAVLEVEHSGSAAQLAVACEALERARHAIYAALAE